MNLFYKNHKNNLTKKYRKNEMQRNFFWTLRKKIAGKKKNVIKLNLMKKPILSNEGFLNLRITIYPNIPRKPVKILPLIKSELKTKN